MKKKESVPHRGAMYLSMPKGKSVYQKTARLAAGGLDTDQPQHVARIRLARRECPPFDSLEHSQGTEENVHPIFLSSPSFTHIVFLLFCPSFSSFFWLVLFTTFAILRFCKFVSLNVFCSLFSHFFSNNLFVA